MYVDNPLDKGILNEKKEEYAQDWLIRYIKNNNSTFFIKTKIRP